MTCQNSDIMKPWWTSTSLRNSPRKLSSTKFLVVLQELPVASNYRNSSSSSSSTLLYKFPIVRIYRNKWMKHELDESRNSTNTLVMHLHVDEWLLHHQKGHNAKYWHWRDVNLKISWANWEVYKESSLLLKSNGFHILWHQVGQLV